MCRKNYKSAVICTSAVPHRRSAGRVHRQKRRCERVSRLKKTAVYGLIGIILLSVLSFFSFRYFYKQYDRIVRNRVQTGFWQSRAGIYAAPQEIRVGERIGRDDLIRLLQRAGYAEGRTADTFWNGTYTAGENFVEIETARADSAGTGSARIEFAGNKIVKISGRSESFDSYRIKPELLTGRSTGKRAETEILRYSDIPENLKNAIILAEDRRFFEHRGIDPKGVLRALWANIVNRKIVQGGSTITQQLVKNTFLNNRKTFERKFSEAFLALALENRMSKEEIFTIYCNEIYLGQYGITGIYGVKMASEAYFNKDLKDLTPAEAATLAGMIRSPNGLALEKNERELIERRNLILRLMAENEVISREEAEIAQTEIHEFTPPPAGRRVIAPYFVDSVVRELNRKTLSGEDFDDDNLRVYTTIDTRLQSLAEKTAARHTAKLARTLTEKKPVPQAALIAMDPKTGEILAMVGGSDYVETQYNRATQAKRPPGSAFKPFVYATAIERGYTQASAFTDSKTEFNYGRGQIYQPANYGDSYAGRKITLKTALAKSSNVVAVQTALRTGLSNVAQKAEDFGFENIEAYPSMALGTYEVTPVELAAAYSVFANRGKRVTPTSIKYIVSGEGSVSYRPEPSGEQVISPETAFLITDMLRAVVTRGTAAKARNALGTGFAGKTGSSKDAWFVGYTPHLVTVARVGYDENEDIGLTGGEAALPLWVDFMREALKLRPELGGKFEPMPAGLVEVTIDPETGMKADPNCPHKEKVIVPRSVHTDFICYRHRVYPDSQIASADLPATEFETEISPEIVTEIPNEELPVETSVPENESSPSEMDEGETRPLPEKSRPDPRPQKPRRTSDSATRTENARITETYMDRIGL
jgi:penicillin-binding protein 1B